jgi:hypothetical protein
MAKRTALHFLCTLLLLFAQQGALTHSVWHLGDHLPAHEHHDHAGATHDDGGDGHSSQSKLCDLHFVLGSVLGGNCASPALDLLPDFKHGLPASADFQRAALTSAPYLSRAPPALL